MVKIKSPKDFKFIGPKPYAHQIETLLFMKDRQFGGILLDMGLGKTRCAIDLARWHIQKNGIKRILIVAPASVLYAWGRQIEMFSEYSYTILAGRVEDRKQLLNNDTEFFIINYEVLSKLLKELANKQFDMLVFDESARYIKNPNAKRTKAAMYLGLRAKYKYILTGTPIADKPLDVWAQFKVMDGGKTFGNNYYAFLNYYFSKTKVGRWYKYLIKNQKFLRDIGRKIFIHCIRKTKEECFDLPSKIYDVIEIKMDSDLKALYRVVSDKVIKEIETSEGIINVSNILTKLLVLQQITSGFTKTNGIERKLSSTPKLDALIDQIETIIEEGSSVVVWCRFLFSISMISKELSKLKIKHITMSGRDGNKKDVKWREFQKSDIPVFICQLQAGGIGIELFKENSCKAQYSIFYENAWSLDVRLQAEDRIHRIGQKNTCIYKDIVVKDTIDEQILQAVKNKKEIADIIMENRNQLGHLLKGVN